MIYHINRLTLRDDVDQDQADAVIDMLNRSGSDNHFVTSHTVGRDIGGDHDIGAVFALADLDAYWQYLIHPAHTAATRVGIPLIGQFETFDITDAPDPDIQTKLVELQRRYLQHETDITAKMSTIPNNINHAALPHRHSD
ncbi:hypothetical protein AD006_31280 (plasmid) [Pseudonocardia sp. EC080610-09]|uniref:Dabb family protein n=1 Tax=unclassified Pseudonocardia TaxID=2619320 RepID=UPI0007057E0E|nr:MULTISPECIES: Dabb family protein [unclassified Pseudonocardia]ALL79661.1 hypothetical protein AD006_31280 [Pseudonocardia sp. EC080610-09]ALL85382.1 hypothetical protein AD017_29955 [Pseudonocardia sp. EC080619-01]